MRAPAWLPTWAALLVLSCPAATHAEWQIRPSVGVNFGQSTTLLTGDLVTETGPGKFGFSVAAAVLGNVLGVEADFGRRSGFLPAKANGTGNVLGSSVTTLTGNITVAVPKRLVEYTLRPYFVGGAGLMAVRIDQRVSLFNVALNTNAIDVGGGVTGFLTPRIGLNWDVRHFRSIGEGPELAGRSLGPPALSFWRANMALAIRY
jgi:hypothetical protein